MGEKKEDDYIVESAESVVNSLLHYERHSKFKVARAVASYSRLSEAHKNLIGNSIPEHMRAVVACIQHNQEFLRLVTSRGVNAVFGEDIGRRVAAKWQRRPASLYDMGRVMSTLKQIAREWSESGRAERDSTFLPVVNELLRRYPDPTERGSVRVLVPGAGLCRLPYDLARLGFDATGCEFSFHMLFTSAVIMNCNSLGANAFTVYPYLLEWTNSWSRADQVMPVQFPDVAPPPEDAPPLKLGMNAADFLECDAEWAASFDVIAGVFFVDTAKNPLDYIDTIWRMLKDGGIWINVGPLLYHFADNEEGEDTIELTFDELYGAIERKGFQVQRLPNVTSRYAVSDRSMAAYEYQCAVFIATKPVNLSIM